MNVSSDFYSNYPFQKELAIAESIAKQASMIIMKNYKKDFSVTQKPNDQGPVTSIDIAVSQYIVSTLKKNFPTDAICSEEEDDDPSRLKKNRVWSIDPIDGTQEFINHSPQFMIHIGLIIDHKSAFGLIYSPVEQMVLWGTPQHGSFVKKNGIINKLSCSKRPIEEAIFVKSRSHQSTLSLTLMEKLQHKESFYFGSMGGKATQLCLGNADAFFYTSSFIKEWDTSAPEAIVRGAGGSVTNLLGSPLRYNKEKLNHEKGVIFSNTVIHQHITSSWRKIKDNDFFLEK
ncbi:hypothetical protein AB834_01385 [PVC group bacterium (ex Bugula neritina AB1)]|nr:hypothetical protein AB834_01385 [PVC group bacterium (ex Bugula neritina AB1)]